MCPACMASVAAMLGGVVYAGGLTALTAKVFGLRNKVVKMRLDKNKIKEK
jgi:hypothetical protein